MLLEKKEKIIDVNVIRRTCILSGKLQLENEEMSIEEFVHMSWEHISKHEFTNNELVEMALGISLATCAKLDLI